MASDRILAIQIYATCMLQASVRSTRSMILTKHWFQVHPHRPRFSHSQRYSPPLWSSFLSEGTMGTLSNDDDDDDDGSENVAKKNEFAFFQT